MANEKKYSGLTKKSVEIPPYSTATIEYNETLPNYYRVQNRGTNRIFCGTSHMPTADRYDFVVGGEKVKLYGEPFNRNNLYILNPSGSTVGVTVVSFAAEFDPTTLALADLELDFSASSLETSTVITGFNSALPQGSNKIGSVDVGNFPSDYAKAGNQKDYTALINTIITSLSSLVKPVKTVADFSEKTVDSAGYEKVVADGTRFTAINFLSNDSDVQIFVTLSQDGYSDETIRLEPKEVLQNISCYCNAIRVYCDEGNTAIVRMVIEIREV